MTVPRNVVIVLVGLAVAAVTLFVSWKFGVVFFLLPLFFFRSWGGEDDGHGSGDEPPPGPGVGGEGI